MIIKEGELLKIGQKTGTMRRRYYILRDHSLFVYNNQEQKYPSNVIPLRGLYINPLKQEKNQEYYGFMISHEHN